MKNRLFTLLLSILFCSSSLFSNNVRIENFSRNGDDITFDLKWDNSWRYTSGGKSHYDAVYLFVKQAPDGGASWHHVNISAASATDNYSTLIPSTQLATLITHNYSNFSYDANTTVTLTLSNLLGAYQDIKVMAIEMVRVPIGPFRFGDGASDRSFHRGDDPTKSYPIQNEDLITRGSTSSDFDGGSTNYTGDIAASFPKGYDNFYCMKYQVTQQQYVDFLNCLPRAAQDLRTESDLSGTTASNVFVMSNTSTPAYGMAIRCDSDIGTGNITFYCDFDNDGIGNESNDGQNKVATHMVNGDIYAYLDWAGLGPMTSMQYEKACRGPLPAVALEFAWGSTLQNSAGSFVNNGTAQEKYSNSGVDGGIIADLFATRVGLNAPSSNSSRELANASYYGIIGLTGRFDNPVIPVFEQSFTGQQGDGELTPGGEADFMDITTQLQIKYYNSSPDRGRVSSFNGSFLNTDTTRSYNRSFRGVFNFTL